MNPSLIVFNLIVIRLRNLDYLVSELQYRGYAIITLPQHSEWGLRAVVADPDEHRVELVRAIANN